MKIRQCLITACALGVLFAQAAVAQPRALVENVSAAVGDPSVNVSFEIDVDGGSYDSITVDILYDATALTPVLPANCDEIGDPGYFCNIFLPGQLRFVMDFGLSPSDYPMNDITWNLTGTGGAAPAGVYDLVVDDNCNENAAVGYLDNGFMCIAPVGTMDGSITVQSPSYDSDNPEPGNQIVINGFQGGSDVTHNMTILNDAVGTLTGDCALDNTEDFANFNVVGGVDWSATAGGPNATIGVVCEVGTDGLMTAGSPYDATLICTHDNGDDMPASPINYDVVCNVSDEPIEHLTLTKTITSGGPPHYSVAGDTVTYNFNIASDGGATVTGPIALNDPDVTLDPCPALANNLADGNSIDCTGSYTVSQTDVDNGSFENCATASGSGGDPQSNQSCVTAIGAEPFAEMEVDKSGTQQPGPDGLMHAGDTILYAFEVRNTGNVTLTNVLVTDTLITDPPNNGTISCPGGNPIPTLLPAAVRTCSGTYAVTQADIDAGVINNLAVFEAECPAAAGRGTCQINREAPDEQLITQEPRVEITKSADPVEYGNAGETITYTFVVTNTGNETLFSIDVTDPLINNQNDDIVCIDTDGGGSNDHIIDLLDPLQSTTCTGTYTIQESDLDSDTLENTATATADCAFPQAPRGEGEGCADDDGSAVIERTADAAHFIVHKDFTDDNTAGVYIVIECTTGLPMMSDATLYEFHAIFDEIDFIVQDYDAGELDCHIYEDVPDGYTQSYDAYAEDDGESGVDPYVDDDGCYFEEVEGGHFHCDITNALNKVPVTVDKVWIDDLAGENGAFLFAGARWRCEPVADLNDVSDEPYKGHLSFFGSPSDPWDYDTFWFYPHFEGSLCSVTELELDTDVFSDDSDCQDLEIFPGHDAGVREDNVTPAADCTIINTRVYAGIPTLSEYGLALLALLMLGVGFVGYRRFA